MSVNSLNGSVYSQGIKISHNAWLDIGSEEWKNTADKDKAAAYQAAIVCGWTDLGIKNIILSEFSSRIDDFTADFIIDMLKELADLFPIEVEQVYEVKESLVFKVGDVTFRMGEE